MFWIVKQTYSVIGCIVISVSLHFVANAQVTDFEGNIYKTVQIGSQLWMAENLKSTRYNDGSAIPLVRGDEWNDLTTNAYCWYKNNYNTFGKVYGALYNGYTVESGKLCPTGWRVPSDDDWITLLKNLGGEQYAGAMLKESVSTHWKSQNIGAANSENFTALPGGGRWAIGHFELLGQRGYWWSTSPYDNDFDHSIWMIQWDKSSLRRVPSIKGNGFSVRCIKD